MREWVRVGEDGGGRGTYEGAEEEVVVVCHGGIVEYCCLSWLARCVDD